MASVPTTAPLMKMRQVVAMDSQKITTYRGILS
jgi:hypothetical protein